MPLLDDLLVLAPDRSAAAVLGWLHEIRDDWQESAAEYPLKGASCREYLEWLAAAAEREGCVYWAAEGGGEPRHAFASFQPDGSLILGVSIESGGAPAPERLSSWLERLAAMVGAPYGLAGGEIPPPSSTADFLELCRTGDGPRLFDGELY